MGVLQPQFKPMLFDFQGKEINFNFEVERDAIVGQYSCGAWFMGEYYIIDSTYYGFGYNEFKTGIIRTVKFFIDQSLLTSVEPSELGRKFFEILKMI